METSINLSFASVLLIIVAGSSLFVMFSLNNISQLVHNDLYHFGLQFSYRWAMPYWVFSGIVFGLCWASILVSISMTLYLLKRGRKNTVPDYQLLQDQQVEYSTTSYEEGDQPNPSEYIQEADLSSDDSFVPEKDEIQSIENENPQVDKTIPLLETKESKGYEDEMVHVPSYGEEEKKLSPSEEGLSS
jgi:hypothetical protein